MLNQVDANLEDRLRVAEQAESEVTRLQPLASEAPQLRVEAAIAQRQSERWRTREASVNQAKQAIESAVNKQARVPELLGNAARAVHELYVALRDIEARRQEAMESLVAADRLDYDIEVENAEAREESMDRDTKGIAYVLAGRHGNPRVKKMLEELSPEFGILHGCNLDDPMYRDVANFVMERVTPADMPGASKKKSA